MTFSDNITLSLRRKLKEFEETAKKAPLKMICIARKHVANLVNGNKLVGPMFVNSMNIAVVKAGNPLIRHSKTPKEGSIHAEVNAVSRIANRNSLFAPNNKKSRRSLARKGIGRARGVVVARFIVNNDTGEMELANSKPCTHCVDTLDKVGIKFVIYSTEDGSWEKKSIAQLKVDPEVRMSGFHSRMRET